MVQRFVLGLRLFPRKDFEQFSQNRDNDPKTVFLLLQYSITKTTEPITIKLVLSLPLGPRHSIRFHSEQFSRVHDSDLKTRFSLFLQKFLVDFN